MKKKWRGWTIEEKRSEGVTILATLALCLGIWNIISHINIILWCPGLFSRLRTYQTCKPCMTLLELARGANFPLLFLNLLYCFSAYKTLRLRSWARLILVIISFIFIFIPLMAQLVHYFYLPKTVITQTLPSGTTLCYDLVATYSPSFVVFLFIIIFFTRPKVKEQFE